MFEPSNTIIFNLQIFIIKQNRFNTIIFYIELVHIYSLK